MIRLRMVTRFKVLMSNRSGKDGFIVRESGGDRRGSITLRFWLGGSTFQCPISARARGRHRGLG